MVLVYWEAVFEDVFARFESSGMAIGCISVFLGVGVLLYNVWIIEGIQLLPATTISASSTRDRNL